MTNVGLRHLKPLTKLKVVQATGTWVDHRGAEDLADALPDVAVHLPGRVFKARRPILRFRRRSVAGFASALIPARWIERRHPDRPHLDWTEDGFTAYNTDRSMDPASARPASIRLRVDHDPSEPDAAATLRRYARTITNRLPKRFATGVATIPTGVDAASATFPRDDTSRLAGVALFGGKLGAVRCEAPPKRFDHFRRLFAFVAASLRVGPGAMVDEEVDVLAHEPA